MKCEFEIHKSSDKRFYFVLKIDDKDVIVSRLYKSKQATVKGIKSMRRNIFCAKIKDTI
jgi:uncharacterized protein YegP (UPF0339 family)